MNMDMLTTCFIYLKEQVIFFHHCVMVEMDCSSPTLIFKERQLASPSFIIWVLSDNHSLLSLGDHRQHPNLTPYSEKAEMLIGLFSMELVVIASLMSLCPGGDLQM